MGAWGVGIFQNDAGEDIKYDYRCKLRAGKTDEEALEELLSENQDVIEDVDEKNDFWFAFSKVLWDYGRLPDWIKDKVIAIIDSGEDLERWETQKNKTKREAELEKLKETLNTPMPARKRVSRLKPYICPWNIGDVFCYQLTSKEAEEAGVKNQYLLLILSEIVDIKTEIKGCFHRMPMVYFKLAKAIPKNNDDVNKAVYIPFLSGGNDNGKEYKRFMYTKSAGKIPKNMVFIGNYNNLELPNDELMANMDYAPPITSWEIIETDAVLSLKKYFS